MAVLCEAISVITRRDSIAAYFRGGWEKFLRDVPNATVCYDDELVRVGFLDPKSVEEYVELLESQGLLFHQPRPKMWGFLGGKRTHTDIVVVDQHRGPTTECSWIEYGSFTLGDGNHEVAACWLFEGERVAAGLHLKSLSFNLATPKNWKPENSRGFTFVPHAKL